MHIYVALGCTNVNWIAAIESSIPTSCRLWAIVGTSAFTVSVYLCPLISSNLMSCGDAINVFEIWLKLIILKLRFKKNCEMLPLLWPWSMLWSHSGIFYWIAHYTHFPPGKWRDWVVRQPPFTPHPVCRPTFTVIIIREYCSSSSNSIRDIRLNYLPLYLEKVKREPQFSKIKKILYCLLPGGLRIRCNFVLICCRFRDISAKLLKRQYIKTKLGVVKHNGWYMLRKPAILR